MRKILIILMPWIVLSIFSIPADAAGKNIKSRVGNTSIDLSDIVGRCNFNTLRITANQLAVYEGNNTYKDMTYRGNSDIEIQNVLIKDMQDKWSKGDTASVKRIFKYMQYGSRNQEDRSLVERIDSAAREFFGNAEWEKTDQEISDLVRKRRRDTNK